MMTVQTVRLNGKEFVILPKRQYERLTAKAQRLSAQDAGDIAESKRRLAEPGRSIPLAQARKRLGI